MKTLSDSEWVQPFKAYLERRFPNRSTSKHHVSDLRVFSQNCTAPLTNVTAHDVDTFIDRERYRGMSPATVKRRAAALKTLFTFRAEELDKPDSHNPVSMHRHAGRQPKYLPRDLSDAKVDRLLKSVKEARDRAMITLMLYAACVLAKHSIGRSRTRFCPHGASWCRRGKGGGTE